MAENLGPAVPVVVLHPEQTRISISEDQERAAIEAAFWATASPHEWVWSREESLAMARYVLWATQRLAAIRQIASRGL